MNWYKEENNKLLIFTYVIPRSSKTEIIGIHNDLLKIKLKAPPVNNEANEELIRLFSNKLKIPRTNIEVISGHKQKRKVLKISNCPIKIINSLIR